MGPSGIINLFAGNYTVGFSGDGGPATSAQFKWVTGVVSDANGNVYIADGNCRIRKVNSAGTISTFAGTGQIGYSGDGGPATLANLGVVRNLTTDAAGNIYFASVDRVRKINITTGIITTVAGNGIQGFSGDGGPATSASLNNVMGIAIDNAGNIFIADWDTYVVRKVNTSGLITTIAGTPYQRGATGDGGLATSAKLTDPEDVAVDQNGHVYVGGGSLIRKISTTGIITKFAGNYHFNTWSIGPDFYNGDNGQANSASVPGPHGLFIKNNILYLADANHRIRKIFL